MQTVAKTPRHIDQRMDPSDPEEVKADPRRRNVHNIDHGGKVGLDTTYVVGTFDMGHAYPGHVHPRQAADYTPV